ncbi:MAG: biotin transporter BioY [Pseudomonadota bacterium]
MLGKLVLGPLLGLVLAIGLTAALIAAGAQVDVQLPGTTVPQSLQTLAVVIAGGLFGLFGATLGALLYLGLGAYGWPVFADGASGMAHLTGSTAGYLWGFVGGAALMGLWPAKRSLRGLLWLFLGALAAHAIILAAGWWHLSSTIGQVNAFERGVEPFLQGGLVKSLIAALGLWAWRQLSTRWRLPRFLLPV